MWSVYIDLVCAQAKFMIQYFYDPYITPRMYFTYDARRKLQKKRKMLAEEKYEFLCKVAFSFSQKDMAAFYLKGNILFYI